MDSDVRASDHLIWLIFYTIIFQIEIAQIFSIIYLFSYLGEEEKPTQSGMIN